MKARAARALAELPRSDEPHCCETWLEHRLVNMGVREPTDLRALSQRAQALKEEFEAHEVANLLWAFAKLDERDVALADALMTSTVQRNPHLTGWPPVAVSMTVWALAALRIRHEDFLAPALRLAEANLPAFSTQGLANLCWGIARLEVSHQVRNGESAPRVRRVDRRAVRGGDGGWHECCCLSR